MGEEYPTQDLPIAATELTDEELLEYSTAQRLKNRILTIFGVLLGILLIIGVIYAIIAMVNHPAETETIRDIMIIFLAIQFSIIGLVLIILIVQLALLTELLRTEVTPILKSTNETLANVRGTSAFMSDQIVKPSIKVIGSFAALRRAVDLLRFRR